MTKDEMSYLQAQIQALEGYVHGLKNRTQQQEEIQKNPIPEWNVCLYK
jgi:hypothetical protein